MKRLLLAGLLLLPGFCLLAQDTAEGDIIAIKKADFQIVFDGYCREAGWESLPPIPLKMYQPHYGEAPSEKSKVFVTFDDKYLYLAGRLYYDQNTRIIATSKKRDALDPGNDYLGILLDTFNDNENALCFQTSPAGIRVDFAVENDGLAPLRGIPFNESWNTFWEVNTHVIDKVWHIEIRIPLSSLRFQEKNGDAFMGMTIWRHMADRQELSVFPLMSNKLGQFSVWRPSQAQKVVFQNINRNNPVYLTPYVLGGYEQESHMNDQHTEYNMANSWKFNAGGDLKYALTSNLTMDLTINTDFAQVEVDDQMVNLTRFDLFFPEKRQFFLERSGIFNLKTGFFDQLFYSRRIGLYEDAIVPIYGGIRMVGRVGGSDIGILNMQTAGIDYYHEDLDSTTEVNSANHGVLRFRRQVINPRSYLGGIMTSKIDVIGNYNINPGIDGVFNLFGNDYLTWNYSYTFDNDLPDNRDLFSPSKIYINWNKRKDVGFGYTFQFSRAGKHYYPELGFEMFEDYTSNFAELRHGWVSNDPSKKILKHTLYLWTWWQLRNNGYKTDVFYMTPGWTMETKNGYSADLMVINRHENPAQVFELSEGVVFQPGNYQYTTFDGLFSTPANKLFSIQGMWSTGTYFDGNIVSISPRLTARASSSVQLALEYQFSQINVPDRDIKYRAHLARLKTELTFTTKISLLMFCQYSSEEKLGVNNIRLRYNPKEGNDLFIVYNENYNADLKREIPHLPFTDQRTLLLKYTYTFIFDR